MIALSILAVLSLAICIKCGPSASITILPLVGTTYIWLATSGTWGDVGEAMAAMMFGLFVGTWIGDAVELRFPNFDRVHAEF